MSTPCAGNGVIVLGKCPGLLRICVRRGAMLSDSIELRDTTGTPVPWPAGTTAWLEVRSGAFSETYPAVISGSTMTITVAGVDTAEWPRVARAAIWIQYLSQPGPIEWVCGGLDEGGCC